VEAVKIGRYCRPFKAQTKGKTKITVDKRAQLELEKRALRRGSRRERNIEVIRERPTVNRRLAWPGATKPGSIREESLLARGSGKGYKGPAPPACWTRRRNNIRRLLNSLIDPAAQRRKKGYGRGKSNLLQ